MSLSKKINRWKNVKHLLLRKTDKNSQNCWKSKILGKKVWRNALALKSKKVQDIFRETFILALLFSAAFRLQNLVSGFLKFCSGYKRLLSEFLKKWGWFQGHNYRFPRYLDYKLKFQKIETGFCWSKSTDNNDINIFQSLENLCTFFLT